jgi:protein transport protein SEC23
MSVVDPHNSYAIFWEIVNQGKAIPQGKFGVIQFQTTYTSGSGIKCLRVTTVARSFIGEQGLKALLPGFDQECCAALVTRVAVYRGENQEQAPLRWIDRQLIQMTYSFAEFRKNSPDSYKMHDNFSLFPVFMFHLRRGNLVQVFGNSPDEMSFYRHYALRENVANTLIMIQPSLDAYELDKADPEPVLLTTASVKADRLLLLDTFFHVIVYSGQTIASWRKEGYHLQEGYENLKSLIEAPVQEATRLMTGRYPRPIFIECDHGGSQARFLLAVLDPARDESQPAIGVAGQQQDVGFMHSEDVSLAVFMEHLKKKVVTYEA